MHFTINFKNIKRNCRECDRLKNENKVIFNNKLKSDKKISIVDSLKMFTQLTVCLFKKIRFQLFLKNIYTTYT